MFLDQLSKNQNGRQGQAVRIEPQTSSDCCFGQMISFLLFKKGLQRILSHTTLSSFKTIGQLYKVGCANGVGVAQRAKIPMKRNTFLFTLMFSLAPICNILLPLSCKISLLMGPLPQVCGGNASREAASPKCRPRYQASRPDNSMQDLSCSQTYGFLARSCLGSVSSCAFRCKRIHAGVGSWAHWLPTDFPKGSAQPQQAACSMMSDGLISGSSAPKHQKDTETHTS